MSESKPQRDGPMQLVGGSLQLEQDLGFQRRQWFAQRVGWALMWAAAAAGLAGFFGRGPLSARTLSDPSGVIEVEFDRFQRAQARSEVHFSLSPAAVRDGRLQIWIDDAYLRGLRIESISPFTTSIRRRELWRGVSVWSADLNCACRSSYTRNNTACFIGAPPWTQSFGHRRSTCFSC